MRWDRRRDLEGGKELGIWLLVDDSGTVERELYVESHEYRDDGFDVYTATPAGEWTHLEATDTADEAFARALEYLDDSGHDRTDH
jgi:hypothetical protein